MLDERLPGFPSSLVDEMNCCTTRVMSSISDGADRTTLSLGVNSSILLNIEQLSLLDKLSSSTRRPNPLESRKEGNKT
jgi:hypothetical protein